MDGELLRPISRYAYADHTWAAGRVASSLWRFATDPQVHLPAGDWRITATAAVFRELCPGSGDLTLTAAVVVHVTA
jgi:hypothetical protein